MLTHRLLERSIEILPQQARTCRGGAGANTSGFEQDAGDTCSGKNMSEGATRHLATAAGDARLGFPSVARIHGTTAAWVRVEEARDGPHSVARDCTRPRSDSRECATSMAFA